MKNILTTFTLLVGITTLFASDHPKQGVKTDLFPSDDSLIAGLVDHPNPRRAKVEPQATFLASFNRGNQLLPYLTHFLEPLETRRLELSCKAFSHKKLVAQQVENILTPITPEQQRLAELYTKKYLSNARIVLKDRSLEEAQAIFRALPSANERLKMIYRFVWMQESRYDRENLDPDVNLHRVFSFYKRELMLDFAPFLDLENAQLLTQLLIDLVLYDSPYSDELAITQAPPDLIITSPHLTHLC